MGTEESMHADASLHNEETVSWQQTKAEDEQRPKVGLLQRIQARRQEAENRQRREEEPQEKEVKAEDEEQEKGEEEDLRSDIEEEERRQETEQEEHAAKGEEEFACKLLPWLGEKQNWMKQIWLELDAKGDIGHALQMEEEAQEQQRQQMDDVDDVQEAKERQQDKAATKELEEELPQKEDEVEEERSMGRQDEQEEIEVEADTKTRRGVIVRLHSLGSAPHLNGSLGLCLYQGEGDRWVVHLDSEEPGRFRNVRQQNLEFVCCGGAVQPMVPQQNPKTAGLSESCENSAEPISDPAMTGKRKHGCQDVQLPLAESFAELEREQLGYCDAYGEKPSKKSKLDDQSQEISVRSGAEGLVEDLVEMPDEAILKRLMLASIEDLAEVVSPEAMSYIVLARACRTRASGG